MLRISSLSSRNGRNEPWGLNADRTCARNGNLLLRYSDETDSALHASSPVASGHFGCLDLGMVALEGRMKLDEVTDVAAIDWEFCVTNVSVVAGFVTSATCGICQKLRLVLAVLRSILLSISVFQCGMRRIV